MNPSSTSLPSPDFNSKDIGLIAYRLNGVEHEIKALKVLLEKVLNDYPTKTAMNTVTTNLEKRIQKIEDENKSELIEKIKSNQQAKFMLAAAIAGPVITFLLAAVMFYVVNGGPHATG